MKHVPHLVVGAPWKEDEMPLTIVQWRHLTKVLRMSRGDPVSYTDGLGRVGEGTLADHTLNRGEEREVERPSDVTIAAAPPDNKDRQRFLVEKLAELGVARLQWLASKHGKERTASPQKTFAWALMATEQSRGAWLMETPKDIVDFGDLEHPIVVCHPGGSPEPAPAKTIVIGPQGGFDEEELPERTALWDLGPTILRVETAAIVAASRILTR